MGPDLATILWYIIELGMYEWAAKFIVNAFICATNFEWGIDRGFCTREYVTEDQMTQEQMEEVTEEDLDEMEAAEMEEADNEDEEMEEEPTEPDNEEQVEWLKLLTHIIH